VTSRILVTFTNYVPITRTISIAGPTVERTRTLPGATQTRVETVLGPTIERTLPGATQTRVETILGPTVERTLYSVSISTTTSVSTSTRIETQFVTITGKYRAPSPGVAIVRARLKHKLSVFSVLETFSKPSNSRA
jgi:hypothetical protein